MNDIIYNPQHPRTEGKRELAGMLIPVQIKTTLKKNAIGTVSDGDEVFVSNGALCIDPEMRCLTKFEHKAGTTQGNFVVSGIPKGIKGKGLRSERYLLYGNWANWMYKKRKLPDFEDINQYYDPGNLKKVIYLSTSGPYSIYDFRLAKLSHLTYREIILGEFPDPKEASKVVIAERLEDLADFLEETRKWGIRPIRLDNLKYNWKVLIESAYLKRMQQEKSAVQ